MEVDVEKLVREVEALKHENELLNEQLRTTQEKNNHGFMALGKSLSDTPKSNLWVELLEKSFETQYFYTNTKNLKKF